MEQINQILSEHKLPIGLSLLGTVLIIGGLFSSGLISNQNFTPTSAKNFPSKSKITASQIEAGNIIKIDISGGVNKPGVYTLESNSRVEDAVNLAEGFSTKANKDYISKQLNLSQKLSDGIKIYIPFEGENINSNPPNPYLPSNPSSFPNGKTSINNASQKELEDLPSIGPVTAAKIIKNRPYSSIDDLISKKSVSRSVFSKIKEMIDL